MTLNTFALRDYLRAKAELEKTKAEIRALEKRRDELYGRLTDTYTEFRSINPQMRSGLHFVFKSTEYGHQFVQVGDCPADFKVTSIPLVE